MTREEMLTDIIRIFGFEHPTTIRFAGYCEKFQSDITVKVAYNIIIAKVYSTKEQTKKK